MKLKRLKLSNRGDTIVEVMVVLAVLSLAFSISYATANHGLAQTRNAEEHSNALGSISSQVEQIRQVISGGTDINPTVPFCMNGSTPVQFPAGATIPDKASDDNFDPATTKYPAACRNGLYYTSVVYDGSQGTYDVRIRWDGTSTLGRQQEELTYRMFTLSHEVTNGVEVTAAPPQIKVTANVIPPRSGNVTPSCSDGGSASISDSITMTLTRTDGSEAPRTQSTTTSSTLFTDLIQYGTYTATVTPPSGYGSCNGTVAQGNVPVTTAPITLTPSTPNPYPANIKIYPICHNVTQRDYLGYYGDFIGYYGDFLGYYGDFLGYYGDPYTVQWWNHTGVDARHTGFPANTFDTVEGGVTVEYRIRTDLGYNSSSGWFYERWTLASGTAYTAPYNHYSPSYNHYTSPYNHYTAPYNHYTPYYTIGVCPAGAPPPA